MKRLFALLGGVLVLSACGWNGLFTPYSASRPAVIEPPIARMKPVSPNSLRFSTASNRAFARHDVKTLLRIVVLPPSARQVAKAPHGAPSWLQRQFKHPGIERETAFGQRLWIVDEPVGRVIRYLRGHARTRPRPLAPFRSRQTNGVRFGKSTLYPFPPPPGRSTQRWLSVQLIPLPGRSTAVLAQAADTWVRLSPPSAVLTSRVKRIDVRSTYGPGPASVLVHVRDRFEVARIVADVNGLGLASPRVVCLDQFVPGPLVTLTFRSANGKVLAGALVSDPGGMGESGPCNPFQLTIGGGKAVFLIGADLLRRIQQDLQVDLAPPSPRFVGDCLRRHGYRTKTVAHTMTARRNGSRWSITFHATGKLTTSPPPPPDMARCLRGTPGIVLGGWG